MADIENAMADAAASSVRWLRVEGASGIGVSSIVNAGLLHTSYAWIHADGTPSEWGHVDADQYGLSRWYRLFECAGGTWIFLAALTERLVHTSAQGVGAAEYNVFC